MRTYRKTISVVELTFEELASMRELLTQAEAGHTSHYAEKKMSDGKFFGISVTEAPPIESTFKSSHRPSKMGAY